MGRVMLILSTVLVLAGSFTGCASMGTALNEQAAVIVANEKRFVKTFAGDPACLQEVAGVLAGFYRTMVGAANLDRGTETEIAGIEALCIREPEGLTFVERGDLLGFVIKYRCELIGHALKTLSVRAQALVTSVAGLRY